MARLRVNIKEGRTIWRKLALGGRYQPTVSLTGRQARVNVGAEDSFLFVPFPGLELRGKQSLGRQS